MACPPTESLAGLRPQLFVGLPEEERPTLKGGVITDWRGGSAGTGRGLSLRPCNAVVTGGYDRRPASLPVSQPRHGALLRDLPRHDRRVKSIFLDKFRCHGQHRSLRHDLWVDPVTGSLAKYKTSFSREYAGIHPKAHRLSGIRPDPSGLTPIRK